MTIPRPSGCRSHRSGLSLLALLLCGCFAHATGFFGPWEYLGSGGQPISATPEFYWEQEVKRIARDFHPPEKPILPDPSADDTPAGDGNLSQFREATSAADLKDFADALKTGQLKPAQPDEASRQNKAARDQLDGTDSPSAAPLPAEYDSEFADYHRGAYAFRLGPNHWDEARKVWEALLKRPVAERHYRSVWAAFMLGKLAIASNDPAAPRWFQMARQLAHDGFADSLGLAADSYGWEGQSEWKQGHPELAAPCYMNQLALGDESAVASLKVLIPGRAPIDDNLTSEPGPTGISANPSPPGDQIMLALQKAATDPLLCRLITAHLLATNTGYDEAPLDKQECTRWLAIVRAAKLLQLKDAEYLGWIAYNSGDYDEARHWLELATPDSPAAEWLRAKLDLRDGKLNAAVKNLSLAFKTISDPAGYTGSRQPSTPQDNNRYYDPYKGWTELPSDPHDSYSSYHNSDFEGHWSLQQSASGDLAQLHLARNDFIQAFDIFYRNNLWEDAAFMAERILTIDELKAYVDKLPPAPKIEGNEIHYARDLRYLLGRRLVREGSYTEASAYLRPPYDKILAAYVQARRDGANKQLSNLQRAQAWFLAAGLARYDGMEFMGTEVAPDGFYFDGAAESTDIAAERLAGHHNKLGWLPDGEPKQIATPLPLLPTHKEVRRLKTNEIDPNMRFHYRLIAGDLALKAARLLKDNTPELADVVNTAGNWVKDTDDKAGDKIYQVMDSRCADTETGRAAVAQHWFVDAPGPWSQDLRTKLYALHQQLNLDAPIF